jgi:hypothetical protein
MGRAVVGLDGRDGEWEAMVEVTVEHEFEYSAERLWSVLADFEDRGLLPGDHGLARRLSGKRVMWRELEPTPRQLGAKS